MSKAQIHIGHSMLPHMIEMEVDRDDLTFAIRGRNHGARTRIALSFKREYAKRFGAIKQFLNWEGFGITETEESTKRPQGCGCDCAGCDQGYHCSKESRDCYK